MIVHIRSSNDNCDKGKSMCQNNNNLFHTKINLNRLQCSYDTQATPQCVK